MDVALSKVMRGESPIEALPSMEDISTLSPSPHRARHFTRKNRASSIPSVPNLSQLLDSEQMNKARMDKLPKPKFIEQLLSKAQSKKQSKHQTFDRSIGKIGKGGMCVEYSDLGTGDFRSPSFQIIDNFNGSSIAPLRYRKHRIYKGKLPMPDNLPGVRCVDENEASTLVITLADMISGIDVDLVFGKEKPSFVACLCCMSNVLLLVCMHNYDVITRRAVFRNVDQRSNCAYNMMSTNTEDYACGANKVVMKASSATVDFEAEATPFYLVHLVGR